MRIRLSDHFTYKKILKFTFPPMIMMVFTSLYGVVDGLFVTNFEGKSALAAINFVYPILNILATFGYMFGAGGSALVAKTLGEGKSEKANKLFSLFVYVCALLGVVFSVVGFFILRPLMQSLGAEGVMLDQAVMYGNILLISLPVWNLQFLFQIFFVTAEKPQLGLYTTLLAGCTNMVLDAMFIGWFGWGLAGAAAATALSQFVGGGIPLVYFFMKNDSLLRLGKTELDGKAMLKATTNGSSELVSGVSGSLVGILYNTQLIKYAGEDGVASYSIMMYVTFIFIGIFFGYANGSAPVIGYHYGAQNHAEMRNLFRKGIVLNLSASAIITVLSLLLSKPLSLVFAGYDPVLYEMTLGGFRIYALSFLFSGIAIFGSSFFTALNNGLVSACLSFLRTVVFQVACVLILPLYFSLDGIWLSIVVAEALAFTVSGVFLFAMRKRYKY
ncbi:MAG: MATE family efflux transporter [Ruminococcaceae bacterium]|nr:MATE family efflux transporter [Oscillospiraceae bacterium]